MFLVSAVLPHGLQHILTSKDKSIEYGYVSQCHVLQFSSLLGSNYPLVQITYVVKCASCREIPRNFSALAVR